MTDKPILAELIERRDKAFEDLREREPERVAKWIQLNAAISGIEAESTRVVKQDEYSGFRKPSEALFAYLDRVQKPQNRDEMCQMLVDGGYGRGWRKDTEEDEPYWDLVRAVYYQIKKKRIKQINGLVGKYDWPKEWFGPVTQKERPPMKGQPLGGK